MASSFAPEFLILLGIDIFLGASILTVLLDRHFPSAFPYILDAAALIGFGELLSAPAFLNNFSTELQFYYSFAYAMISVLTLFATNLYLVFLRRRPFESAMVGVFGTIPAGLGILYFTSAFVNGLSVSLPVVPVVPIEGVYALFGISVALVVFSLMVFGRRSRRVTSPELAKEEQPIGPIPARVTGNAGHVILEQVAGGLVPERSTGLRSSPEPESHAASVVPPMAAAGRSVTSIEMAVSQSGGTGHDASKGSSGPTGEVRVKGIVSVDAELLARSSGSPSPQASGAVLVEGLDAATPKEKLTESMKLLEKTMDRPVRINAEPLRGTLKDAKGAYLTPAGMVMVEDVLGRAHSLSLLDLPTDVALKLMNDAMHAIKGRVSQ